MRANGESAGCALHAFERAGERIPVASMQVDLVTRGVRDVQADGLTDKGTSTDRLEDERIADEPNPGGPPGVTAV